MDYLQRLRIAPGTHPKLQGLDPAFTGGLADKKAAEAETGDCQQRLRALQELLYAEERHSLLICLQAMDTGGKDGTVNHVLGAMNPQGCRVAHFREPSPEEAAHDFLWRYHQAAPARGEVVIFNRSHYEGVLIERVHGLVPKETWSKRYEAINAFEQGLAANGTRILKFFLHISKEEQLRRFKDRLDDPTKQWKISEADYAERKYWNAYSEAYEDALARCSTAQAPWHAIPADHKWFRNLAVARIVVQELEELKMSYPKPAADLARIRAEYHAAKKS
ncbi:MAG TPA: polyphosphate kinase 2 family protein [Gammaproteobacteria bacterium]|nr:polyphosphate kinase 2 family protein [Gammaproteobacteria bacterium]